MRIGKHNTISDGSIHLVTWEVDILAPHPIAPLGSWSLTNTACSFNSFVLLFFFLQDYVIPLCSDALSSCKQQDVQSFLHALRYTMFQRELLHKLKGNCQSKIGVLEG